MTDFLVGFNQEDVTAISEKILHCANKPAKGYGFIVISFAERLGVSLADIAESCSTNLEALVSFIMSDEIDDLDALFLLCTIADAYVLKDLT